MKQTNQMVLGEFQTALQGLSDVQLFLTDPPYNLGFDYGPVNDKMSASEYRKLLNDLVHDTYPLAKEGASMVIINYPEIIAEHFDTLTSSGWQFHQWLTWTYQNNSFSSKRKYRKGSRAMLWLVKGEPKYDRQAVVQPYRNPTDKRVQARLKKGFKGAPLLDWWEIQLVKKGSSEHLGYSNQMPQELLRRWILACSDEGDLVVDPFSGTGSTCRTAKLLDRAYFGCDANPTVQQFWSDL